MGGDASGHLEVEGSAKKGGWRAMERGGTIGKSKWEGQ